MFGSSRLFISYRRSDAEAIARSLYEALKARFGADRIFFDTASIPWGEDFRRVVRERIGQSAAVLVVIGPGWAAAANERGRRLWQDDDPVRFELVTALENRCRILPLRVGGAETPDAATLPPALQPLSFLNMPQLRAEAFDRDVDALYRQLVGQADELTLWSRLKALAVGAPMATAVIAIALLAANWTGLFSLLGVDAHTQRLLLATGGANAGEPVLLARIDAASERRLQRPFAAAQAAAWRRDHARLVDRAARAGARAVAFDLYFEEPHGEADEAFAAAVRRASERQPPMRVVFGIRALDGDAPRLAAPLRAVGVAGSLCLAQRGGGALWTTPLAVIGATEDRADAMVPASRPSLALAALAPGRLLEADVARRELRFDGPTPNPPLRYSGVERERVARAVCRTLHPGDDVLALLVRTAPAGHWAEPIRSVSYADLLVEAGADERLRDRIVLVGATALGGAAPASDLQVVLDGFVPRNVFGVELQADAIATLAGGRVPQLPTADRQLATIVAAIATGAAVAFALYRRRAIVRRGALGLLSAAWVLLAWALARHGFLLDLVSALLAVWLSALAVRAIQSFAERHPVLRKGAS